MCKSHKKTPVPESLSNKVTGLYLATSLRCFLMNFVRYSKDLFYRTPSGDCFCSAEKYFTDKIVKTLWKKKKKWKQPVRKTTTHANPNLITIYIKSSYPFTIQKCLYFSFLCFSWYIENHEFLEIMQSHWGFIYYRKLCLIFGLKKIVFYLYECNNNI